MQDIRRSCAAERPAESRLQDGVDLAAPASESNGGLFEYSRSPMRIRSMLATNRECSMLAVP